jgi:hypothetical protein
MALRAQLNTSIHTLWTSYAVIGGAAAAFGSSSGVTWVAAFAVTGMFWPYTGGHLALLRQSLRASEAVRRDIQNALVDGRLDDSALKLALREGAANRNPLINNTVIHLFLDLFITGAIWVRIVSEAYNPS